MALPGKLRMLPTEYRHYIAHHRAGKHLLKKGCPLGLPNIVEVKPVFRCIDKDDRDKILYLSLSQNTIKMIEEQLGGPVPSTAIFHISRKDIQSDVQPDIIIGR